MGQSLVRPLSLAGRQLLNQPIASLEDPCAPHTCSARNLFRVDSSARTGACPTVTLAAGWKEGTAQRCTAQAC